jgi:alpha-aminoadipate carrier protein LysW
MKVGVSGIFPVPRMRECRIKEFRGERIMVTCPVCDGDIDVDEEEVDEGDTLSCDECGAALKVLGKDPLELESAEALDGDDEEEDPDEDDEDEDEEEEDEEEDDWK